VVVDPRSGSRGPDEDLQGVGAILAVEGMGHVPVFACSRFSQQGKDVSIEEGGIPRQMGQQGDGSLEGQLRGEVGELLEAAGIQGVERGRRGLSFFVGGVAR